MNLEEIEDILEGKSRKKSRTEMEMRSTKIHHMKDLLASLVYPKIRGRCVNDA